MLGTHLDHRHTHRMRLAQQQLLLLKLALGSSHAFKTDLHLRLARLGARLRAWRRAASSARGIAVASGKVQVHAQCRQAAGAIHWWSAWLRRRAAWRRGVERRAAAHGGWTRQHLPCMRGFDGRAAFLEEGSSGTGAAPKTAEAAASMVVGIAYFGFALCLGSYSYRHVPNLSTRVLRFCTAEKDRVRYRGWVLRFCTGGA